jgi:drug/metabolite transporter (DMT)-like permease
MIRFVLFAVYYALNTLAFTISVLGGTSESLWLPLFILTNVVGMTGTWILMQLYKRMDANIATAVTLGGGFLITQIVISLLFKTELSVIQYIGVFVIACGLFFMVKGERKRDSSDTEG